MRRMCIVTIFVVVIALIVMAQEVYRVNTIFDTHYSSRLIPGTEYELKWDGFICKYYPKSTKWYNVFVLGTKYIVLEKYNKITEVVGDVTSLYLIFPRLSCQDRFR